MKPYFETGDVQLYLGDCRDVLPTISDSSIDAIITDPPYEIAMMGKPWDGTGIAYDTGMWRECLRALKPGGYLLAFGAPRTYHRLACAIEDAGFGIADSIHWIYGNGFPKGQDIARSIDRRRDDHDVVLQVTRWLAAARDAAGWTNARIDALFGFNGMAGLWTTQGVAAIVPNWQQWQQLKAAVGFGDEMDQTVQLLNARKGDPGSAWQQREVVGHRAATPTRKSDHLYGDYSGDDRITAPASNAARAWAGWNTALKPAHEPIVLARKSTGFDSTVANVLRHGVGALNIDATRIPAGRDYAAKCASVVGLDSNRNGDTYGDWTGTRTDSAHPAGRWPTNVVFSHSPSCAEVGPCTADCPVADLDAQGGHGGASRFFPAFRYEAKASRGERPRNGNVAHPTVKPLALMRWLVRLVTPAGGSVLDPFAGSGTTLEAALLEGACGIGIEREGEYAELARIRLSKPMQTGLFTDGGAA